MDGFSMVIDHDGETVDRFRLGGSHDGETVDRLCMGGPVVTPQENKIDAMAISIARMEEMLKSLFNTSKEQAVSLKDLDERVRILEQAVQRIETNQKPGAPWYSVVGAIVGIVTGIGSLVALIAILSTIGP